MPELPPPEHPPKTESTEESKNKPHKSKRRRNWERTGAIAGVFGAAAGIIALYPVAAPVISSAFSHNEHMYDGPIAQIAIREKGWDKRGFTADDLTTTADQVRFRFAGHYMDPVKGDTNPTNDVCEWTLHANPAPSYPYGGESGFVYLQSGTTSHPESAVLNNPTPDEIYKEKLDFGEFVPKKCWPGNMTFPDNG